MLAILSLSGRLPKEMILDNPEAVRVVFRGVPHEVADPVREHSFEQMGVLFEDLKSLGVTQVVMGGSLNRPALDPGAMDSVTQALAPRIMSALHSGDDAILRLVIQLFEEQGFSVLGAHEVSARLTARGGALAGPDPDEEQFRDIERAGMILAALSPLDLGQGAVVARGLCLGIETLQGTDALLQFVARTPKEIRHGASGVLLKAPKAGQDLRADMPAIGPTTVERAAAAGLAGIAIAAGQVLILERDTTLALADNLGVFLYAVEG